MKSIFEILALYFLRGLCVLLKWLPWKLAHSTVQALLKIVFLFNPRFRKIAFRNLRIAFPEVSQLKREEIYSESLNVLVDNFITFCKLPCLTGEKLETTVSYSNVCEVLNNLEKSKRGSGVIFATMHFGPFELLQHAHAHFWKPFNILARGFNMPCVDEWWDARRTMLGNSVIRRRGGFKSVLSLLKEGKDVAMLVDQNVKANHAVFVDLFGLPAATTRSAVLASIRTGAPIVFGYMFRDGPRHFKAVAEPVFIPDKDNSVSDDNLKTIERVTTEINRKIENAVRAHPEHWFWIHRRFKTRPGGEPENIYS